MPLKLTQWIHIAQIVLGGVGSSLAFLGYGMAVGVTSIWVAVLGAVGAYVGGSSS